MNIKKNLIKRKFLETVFINDLGRSKICGIGVIVLSVFVPFSVSHAVQPKAGDLIVTMPTDKVLIDKWGQASPPISKPNEIDETITVFVKRFVFRGNSKIKSKELLSVLSNYVNKDLNFSELQLAVSLISKEYRSRGLWAMAYLPEQELKNGMITINILEGKIGKLQFIEEGDTRKSLNLPQEEASKFILRGQKIGEMLDVSALETSVKNLDNVPGITVAASLLAGMGPGETDIAISMSNTELVTGSIRMDNHGSNSAGAYRLSGSANFDGMFNLGDRVSISSLQSEGINYSSLGFNFPVSYDGARAELSYSFLKYKLGEQFRDIQAKGSANNYSLQIVKTLPKIANINLSTSFSLAHKKLLDQTSAGVSADKIVDLARIALKFDDGKPGQNVNFGNVTLTRGNLNLSGNNTDLAMDKQTANRHGDFEKIEYSVGRLQRLSEKNYLNVAITGQVAFDNLDSSEKMSLGGPSGVRAYPTGEGMGDTAAIFRTEFRHNFSNKWQGIIFYDHGATTLNNRTWTNWNSANTNLDNSYQLKGAGIGLNLINNDDYDFGIYAGRRIDQNPGRGNTGNDGDGTLEKLRFWLLFSRKF